MPYLMPGLGKGKGVVILTSALSENSITNNFGVPTKE
jgi:hypothetical protein